MADPAVSLRDLTKSYNGQAAVASMNFDVAAGEVFGLLGPNGAGKTTTLECIIGLRRPDAGAIHVHGIDAIAHPDQVKPLIGCQLQATSLQDKITPRQALRLFASFYARPANVDSLLHRFSLSDKADDRYETLSGGQRQRLALALAFVNQPRILFLDEPTAGVDPEARRQLHESIRQFRRDGLTVILTTHDIDEAESLCDRVAIINHGRLIACATPADLTANATTGKASAPLASHIIFRPRNPLEPSFFANIADLIQASSRQEEWELSTHNVSHTLTELIGLLAAGKNEVADLRVRHPSLEDAYLHLVGSQS